jgi:predicted nicotinamide N-methyase
METDMFSIEQFNRDYQTESRNVVIDGRTYTFLVPESIDRFIDPENPLQDFPLWAKIWQAGVVLAGYLSRLPVEKGKRILEIGSGLGLVGIVAACNGHDVTLTDYNVHALNFTRANALINGCGKVRVERLDWNHPHLDGEYDIIIGSEIVYKNEDIDQLAVLFDKYLPSDGSIILVEEMRRTLTELFKRLDPRYHISVKKNTLRAADEQSTVLLIQMRPRFDILSNKQ